MMIRRGLLLDRRRGATLQIGLTGEVALVCLVSQGELTAGPKQILRVRRLVLLWMIPEDNLHQAASGIETVKETGTAEVHVIEWTTWTNDEARGVRAAVGMEVPAHLGDFLHGYGTHLAAVVLGEDKRHLIARERSSEQLGNSRCMVTVVVKHITACSPGGGFRGEHRVGWAQQWRHSVVSEVVSEGLLGLVM